MNQLDDNLLGIITTDEDGIIKSVSYNNGTINSGVIGSRWHNAFQISEDEHLESEGTCPKVIDLPETGQKIFLYPSYNGKGNISGHHILIKKADNEENPTQFLNKMICLGKITPGIAHEICNPLTYISGWLQIFHSQSEDNDPRKKTYETLINEFDRISRLVGNLLEFAKQTPKSKNIFNVNRVIENVVLMVGYTLKTENIELIKSPASDELYVTGDNNMLMQVVLNLVQNAREALPNGGKIYLSTNIIDDNSIIIEVRDTGTGIPEDRLSSVFRKSVTTKSKGKGAGLGLSVCKNIIEEYCGTIDIDSKLGVGTVVKITLPVKN